MISLPGLTRKQLAEQINVGIGTTYALQRMGMPFYKFGGAVRFYRDGIKGESIE